MKKNLILLAFSTLLFSCAQNTTTTTKLIGEPRIIGKEYTSYEAYAYQIIEIDSVEYVANANGGICPLVKNK